MHTVPLTHQLVTIQDDFDLDKIIESGQCFRPQKLLPFSFRRRTPLSDSAGRWAIRRCMVWLRLGVLGQLL